MATTKLSAELIEAINKEFIDKSGKKKSINLDSIKEVLEKIEVEASLLNKTVVSKPKKAPKDPNAPKKPLNDYMRFCNAYKAVHKGEKVSKELTRDAAARWNSVKGDKEKVEALFEEYKVPPREE